MLTWKGCVLYAGLLCGPAFTSFPTFAQEAIYESPTYGRWVIVNSKLLDTAELALVDRLNCGNQVPDGIYWLNLANGTWGYVGVAGAETLPDCGQARSNAQAASSSANRNSNDGSSSPEVGRYQSALNHISSTWGTPYSDPKPY